MVLRDSFIRNKSKGNKIAMIACISPGHVQADHTLNTIKYADRLKDRTNIVRTSNKKSIPDYKMNNIKYNPIKDFNEMNQVCQEIKIDNNIIKDETNNDKNLLIKRTSKSNIMPKIIPPWNNNFKDKVNILDIKK